MSSFVLSILLLFNNPPAGAVPPKDIRGLCEPQDERWAYPSKEDRKEIRSLIKKTCRASGVSDESCKYFYLVSGRESSYRAYARHKLAADTAAAMRWYLSQSILYGWETTWPYKARKQEDLSQLDFEKDEDPKHYNPYFMQVDRWLYGLGLGGLNVSLHLKRVDPEAPPEILCDPVINVMVQIDMARSAVRRFRAKSFLDVNAVYGGRTTYDSKGRAIAARHEKRDYLFLRRCKKYDLNCLTYEPQLGKELDISRMSTHNIYQAAEEIRGAPLPPFDLPWEKIERSTVYDEVIELRSPKRMKSSFNETNFNLAD